MSEKSRPSIFWFFAAFVLPFFWLTTRIRVIDGHKLPRSGALIIAPNHFSEIDPLVTGRVVWKLGRVPRFLAKASLFRVPVLGLLLRASGQIPVERAGASRGNAPLQAAKHLVDTGRAVIIYPEGSLTRDPDMWPMRGRSGAARMALAENIPVIPVAHWGTGDLMGRYSKRVRFFPRSKIFIKVGDPVDLSAYSATPLDSKRLAEATELIMRDITSLLEDLREQKAPEARWDPKQHHQKETGRFED